MHREHCYGANASTERSLGTPICNAGLRRRHFYFWLCKLARRSRVGALLNEQSQENVANIDRERSTVIASPRWWLQNGPSCCSTHLPSDTCSPARWQRGTSVPGTFDCLCFLPQASHLSPPLPPIRDGEKPSRACVSVRVQDPSGSNQTEPKTIPHSFFFQDSHAHSPDD
jgi:hypothetical protein